MLAEGMYSKRAVFVPGSGLWCSRRLSVLSSSRGESGEPHGFPGAGLLGPRPSRRAYAWAVTPAGGWIRWKSGRSRHC